MGEINVVPYIDVMLVLLIIFMITAPLLTQGIKVESAESERADRARSAQERRAARAVGGSPTGDYYLNIGDNEDSRWRGRSARAGRGGAAPQPGRRRCS